MQPKYYELQLCLSSKDWNLQNQRIKDKLPYWLLALFTPVVSESMEWGNQLIQL